MGTFRNVGRWASAFALAGWCSFAGAFSISLVPSPASPTQGVPFALDIVAAGLPSGEFISTYDLNVGFGAGTTLLDATSSGALGLSIFCASLSPPSCPALAPTAGPGTVNVVESSFELDSFFATQGDPVTVAVLTFVGSAPGPATFTLSANALGGSTVLDQNGDPVPRDLLAPEFALDIGSPASITVVPRGTVPEPSTSLLACLALLVLASGFRRQPR